MRLNRSKESKGEPVGIVIADNNRSVSSTRFSAFVWGPVPSDEELDIAQQESAEVMVA